MNTRRPVIVLCCLIAVLALVAAGSALLWQGGPNVNFTTERGQVVPLQGGGLYRYDSVSTATQGLSQDLVTLFIGIPLLLVSTGLFARGSLRGKVLLIGTLGYFLYTYTSICMLTAYNELFLVYVVLFSVCLFAFVMSLLTISVTELPAHFSDKFPRKTIAGFSIFLGAMLAVMWLGRIVPPLFNGTPPVGLDNATTLVIQVLDLGIVVPTAVLAGVLLLRRAAYGYLLSAVVLGLGITMGLATSAMVVGQLLRGVDISPVEVAMFPMFLLINLVLAALMLRSISDAPAEGQERDSSPAVPSHTAGTYAPSAHKG